MRQREKLYLSTIWTKTDAQKTLNHKEMVDVLFQLLAGACVQLTPAEYELALHSIHVDSSASSYTQSLFTVWHKREGNNTKTNILPESGS